MTSRGRVLQSIRHQEPDKVPVDLGSNPSSGISAIAYSNLIGYLNWEGEKTRIYDVVQQLAQPTDRFVDHFQLDIVDVGRTFNTRNEEWKPVQLSNGLWAEEPIWFNPERNEAGEWIARHSDGTPIAKMPQAATFYDQTIYPWEGAYPDDFSTLDDAMSKVMWAAFAHSPWDHSSEPDFWQSLREKAIALRASTDKAIMVVAGCNLFEWGTFLRRMDNFLMDLYLEPTKVEALLDALMERHLKTLEKICQYVGDVVDIIRFGDDLGTMNGPFMDPAVYRKLFKPRHAQLNQYVKANSKMHTFLHSCGSIYQLMPDLIEAGFDIINPVQTQCRDMQPELLKREFGKEITFWGGGIETVGTLNNGSDEIIRVEVLQRLEILSKGGGFIFNPIHNIMPDVPPKNIIAMFNAVREFNGEGPLSF